MHTQLRLLIVLLGCTQMAAAGEDAQSILRTMGERQIARWDGVERYAVDQSVMGNRMTQTFERFEVEGADGKPYPAFRMAGQRGGSEQCAEFLEQYATGLEMVGDAHASEVERGMAAAGLPPGLLKATGSDPWATMDSRMMMNGMAVFARAAAEGERTRDDGRADAVEAGRDMAEFAQRARLVGRETVDGREAFHLLADGLNRTEQVDGQQFTFRTVSLWVDAQEYVPLRTKIEGVASSGAESRPVTIEKFERDYRTVGGSRMYQPYTQLMRMSGVLDAQQKAQMAEAQAQIAEMEQQLAQMEPAQRQMVMNQMGPQLETMKRMSSGGGFEMTTQVHGIVVNPPATAAAASGAPCGGAPSSATAAVTSPTAGGATAQDPDAARQACLQEKVRQAQAAQQKKRGVGKLLGAVSRAASMLGEADVARAAGDVYSANATASDLAEAARDLGLSEDEIAECEG